MDAWLHKFCKYTQRNIYFRHAIALPLHNYKAKTDARVTMQKMNSSTAVILLCPGLCGTKGSTLTAFSPGISTAAHPLVSSLPVKFIAKLHLNFSWQDGVLMSFSQGRAVASLGDSCPPHHHHHKAKTSINTVQKAPTPGKSPLSSLSLTLSPHCTLLYFGLVQPEESSSPHSSI